MFCLPDIIAQVKSSIINYTDQEMKFIHSAQLGIFLTEPTEKGFEILFPIRTSGHCYFTMNDEIIDLFWYYNVREAREYYGIVNSGQFLPWIRIVSPGIAQYILYPKN